MNRGEIYRTWEKVPERGEKPGFYVVVSRQFIAAHEDIATVVCAPVYGKILGLATEVVIGPEQGVAKSSAIRCDFVGLLRKDRLTHFAGTLAAEKLGELDRALAIALDLPIGAATVAPTD